MMAEAMEVVADVATVPLGKRGHVIRVQVKDAGNGNGAAVDVREYVTEAAHQWRTDRKYRDLAKGTSGIRPGGGGCTRRRHSHCGRHSEPPST